MDADAQKILKLFKPDAPPNFKSLPMFDGRKGEDLTLADKVRLQVTALMNPKEAPKMQKMMGKLKLADGAKAPQIEYKPVGERDKDSELPDVVNIGDREYSRNYLLYRMGLGNKLRADEEKRRVDTDDLYPDFLGRLKAKDRHENRVDQFERDRGIEPMSSKYAGEGGSIDTAALNSGMYGVKNLRDALNVGRKLPQKKIQARNDAERVQVKKEALQTFFLAGLLKTAGDDLLTTLSSPTGLAAFLQGFFKRAMGEGGIDLTGGNAVLRKPDIVAPQQTTTAPKLTGQMGMPRMSVKSLTQQMRVSPPSRGVGHMLTQEGRQWNIAEKVKQLLGQPSPSL